MYRYLFCTIALSIVFYLLLKECRENKQTQKKKEAAEEFKAFKRLLEEEVVRPGHTNASEQELRELLPICEFADKLYLFHHPSNPGFKRSADLLIAAIHTKRE